MKEFEIELQESGAFGVRNEKLNKRCSFVERKKREATLRRRRTSNIQTPSLLLIAGTTKTVHTIKQRFQESISAKTNKDNNDKQLQEEKLHLQKQNEEASRNTVNTTKLSTEKLNLPAISMQSNGSFTDKNNSDNMHNNSSFPRKIKLPSRKRNWKPSKCFHSVLPPIEESHYDVVIPSEKLRVARSSTPLPLL